MSFDIMSILAYVAGLLLTIVFCRIFIRPIKWIMKAILNGILGGLILAAVNYVGGFAGFTVIINPVSALISGFLGIPGVALVIILQYIL